MRRSRKLKHRDCIIILIVLLLFCTQHILYGYPLSEEPDETLVLRSGSFLMHPLPAVSCHVTNSDYVSSLQYPTFEKFILPAILFMVMVGLLILKARIVERRTIKQKGAKFLESPSDNPG